MGIIGRKVKSFNKVSEQVIKKSLVHLSIQATIQCNHNQNSQAFLNLLEDHFPHFTYNLPISPSIKCLERNGEICELRRGKFRIMTNNYNNQHHQHD